MIALYPRPESFIGHEIDGYRIEGVLGIGGMGIVFKATQIELSRKVALKIINPSLAHEESFLRRFKAEARALARIHHPNIVVVYNFKDFERGFYIAMEYVEGITLADYMRKKKCIPWQEAIPIFQQVLSALQYTHNRGIIHRDIKPSNLILQESHFVKITDFGLAKILQESASSHDNTLTVNSGGTLLYMPPEQIRGLNNVDHRGDLFSVGMTLYEAITGQLPFDKNESGYYIQKKIVEESFQDIRKHAPTIPRPLARAIMKAIEKEPHKRFQSAAEMIAALEETGLAMYPSHASSPLPPPPVSPIPFSEYSNRLYAILGILIVGLTFIITASNARALTDFFQTLLPSKPITLAEQLENNPRHGPGESTLSQRERPVNRQASVVTEPPLHEVEPEPAVREEELAPASTSPPAPLRSPGSFPSQHETRQPFTTPQEFAEPSAIQATTGSVRITSTPRSADVHINGIYRGQTPLFLDDLGVGALEVELRKENHIPLLIQDLVQPLDITYIEGVLTPIKGVFRLTVNPPSTIYINGRIVTPAPQGTFEIPLLATEHEVSVSNARFGEWTRTVSIQPNDTTAQAIDFTKKIKIVVTAFDSEGHGLPAEIYVDEKPTGRYTPSPIEISPGMHNIRVVLDGYSQTNNTEFENYERSISKPLRFTMTRNAVHD